MRNAPGKEPRTVPDTALDSTYLEAKPMNHRPLPATRSRLTRRTVLRRAATLGLALAPFYPPARTAARMPPARIPDEPVPPGFALPGVGAANFDPNTGVLGAQSDWILVASTLESILPIPSGWTTRETGSSAYYLFSATGDLARPTILIRLGAEGTRDDARASADVAGEFARQVEATPNAAVIANEIVDADRAYVLARGTTPSGRTRDLLEIIARLPGAGWFHTFSAFADEDDWPRAYRLLRTIVAYWMGLDGTPFGIALPESLGT